MLPRYLRQKKEDINDPLVEIHGFVDVPKSIPLTDENGVVVKSLSGFDRVSGSDYYGKFDFDDFKLVNMVRAGVPLKVVDFSMPVLHDLDNIDRVLQSVEDAKSKLSSYEESLKQFKSDFEEPKNVVENEN